MGRGAVKYFVVMADGDSALLFNLVFFFFFAF